MYKSSKNPVLKLFFAEPIPNTVVKNAPFGRWTAQKQNGVRSCLLPQEARPDPDVL